MKSVAVHTITGFILTCLLLSGCNSAKIETTSSTDAQSSPKAASTPSATRTPSPLLPTTPTTPTKDAASELRAAVQAYSDAFLTGDAAAYDMLSQRCRNRRSPEQFQEILDSAKAIYGSPLPIRTFSAEVQGNMARVTYTYDLRAIDQESEPWVKEGSLWREDDC